MNSKFSNFEQLQKSYNALEKEFTKKCQLVAQLQAQLNASSNCNNCEKTIDMVQKKLQDGTSEYSPPKSEEEFFAAFPAAKQFQDEMRQKISDPVYCGYADRYIRAYTDFLLSRIVPCEQLACDPEFLQRYIFGNAQIADQLLQSLFTTQAVICPTTISGNSGNMTLSQPTRPKTISEASELAKKYFN